MTTRTGALAAGVLLLLVALTAAGSALVLDAPLLVRGGLLLAAAWGLAVGAAACWTAARDRPA